MRPAPAHRPAARVLVVEDDEDLRVILEQLLVTEGYEVLAAGDVISALAASEGRPLHAAIVDLHLPHGLTGRHLANALTHRDPPVPVVMMTGERSAKVPDGVALLPKPFHTARLLDTLRAFA